MKLLKAVTFCLLASAIGPSQAPAAETYPSRPIRFIVPFPPGGGTDRVARLLARPLSESFDQPVIVDNRPGAGGVVGSEIAVHAAADGHTLLLGSPGPLTINPALRAKMPYRTLRDFTPITLATISPFTLTVHPSSAARTVQELVALAKSRPGQLNYGSGGNGSVSHFSAEQFKRLARVDIVHIPFKGAAPSVGELLANRLQLIFENLPTVLPYVRSDRLRVLGVGTRSRSSLLPDVPTISESGVPGYESSTAFGVLFPAKVPPAIVARMNTELVRILRSPETVERLAGQGLQAQGGSPADYSAHLKAELAKYARLAKMAGIRIE